MGLSNLKLSVLDLCPVISGASAAQALRDTLSLARYVDRLNFTRYWVAEHHSMAGIASASPELIIGHIAQVTHHVRVGSGGIMLPNHAPLRIAEAFRTLEAFHPGRIDLGVGRAPGSGTASTLALRGHTERLGADDFPHAVGELQAYLSSRHRDARTEGVVAMPTADTSPELWMLGSSDFGARLAAERGLPFAFAQHFSPLPAPAVLNLYREHFKPSSTLAAPRALIAVHVICGATDAEADSFALPADISFYRYRTTGRSIPLPTFNEANANPLTADERARLPLMSFPKFVGSPATVQAALSAFLDQVKVDELMVLTMIPDIDARQQSYARLAALVRA